MELQRKYIPGPSLAPPAGLPSCVHWRPLSFGLWSVVEPPVEEVPVVPPEVKETMSARWAALDVFMRKWE